MYVDWLEDRDAPRSDRFEMGRPLSHWVCHEHGDVAVDRLLRQEPLAQDLARRRDEMNLKIKIPTKTRTVSNTVNFRSVYGAREIDRIAARHQGDLAQFNDRFE